MSKYTVVSEVSNAILKLLRKELVPEVIQNEDGIILGNPSEKGDASLCVFLYDMKEDDKVRETGMVSEGMRRQRYPSMYLSLYYMITAFSSSDIKYRGAEEQKILLRAIQVLRDFSVLRNDTFEPVDSNDPRNIRIEMLKLENDEKLKIFNMPNMPYKISAFYSVAPIELESTKTKAISRVHEIDITFENGRSN